MLGIYLIIIYTYTYHTTEFILRLTLSTGFNMTDKMRLTDVNGELHFLTQDQIRMMLTIGWLSFFTSWLMNILFYKVHPSSVDFCIRDKCFIYVLGKRKSLLC